MFLNKNTEYVYVQVEAKKWKERGKTLFSEKKYAILVDYYTLAMQYVPSNDKEFVAILLSNRSLAHFTMGNFQKGLEDAKSCTRFRPDWHKVCSTFSVDLGRPPFFRTRGLDRPILKCNASVPN